MTQEIETVALFGAKDVQGRIYLVDARDLLPENATDIREFAVAPDRVQCAILAVELEEMRGIPITVHVGDYRYRSEALSSGIGGTTSLSSVEQPTP